MTRRIRLLWKLLLGFFGACTLASLAAWGILLSTICSNPRTAVPETQHVIAYNCHGITVYISHFENALLHWLIPFELLFIFLSMPAAAMVVLGAANVRINVQRNAVPSTQCPKCGADVDAGANRVYPGILRDMPADAGASPEQRIVSATVLKCPRCGTQFASIAVRFFGVLTPRGMLNLLLGVFLLIAAFWAYGAFSRTHGG